MVFVNAILIVNILEAIVILLFLLQQRLTVISPLSNIRIAVNDSVYLKDPDSTELGRTMVKEGIELIDELGFEAFTFKKLGQKIGSPESTIYRYFENKHRFLLYITSWYWAWLEYRLVVSTANINDPEECLSKAIGLLTLAVEEDSDFAHINEVKLNKIVISESIKAYHTRKVDAENKQGCFSGYTNLVKRVAGMILQVNANYEYPNMLVSTLIEGAHQQTYFSEHLPSLTDCSDKKPVLGDFFNTMVFSMIK